MATFRRPLLAPLLLLAVVGGAHAAEHEDPDTEAARRHFARAKEHYDARDYAAALKEFEAAREVKPLPQFEYNIGRCHDRLEHYPEAVAAYRSYLAARPDAEDAAEVNERIGVLEKRLENRRGAALVPGPAAPSAPVYRRGWFWGLMGGIVAVAAVGVGLSIGLGTGGDSPPASLGGVFDVVLK